MQSNTELQIIAPDPKTHREAMVDLWCKIFGFGGGNYFTGRTLCEAGYLDGSHYDWAASRLGMIDGQIVAHFGVWGYDMRVGSATVRCGGIGAVCTHPEFRRRGYLMKVAQASIDAMRDTGYDVSLLFGIDGFYDRLGYSRAFDYAEHVVPAEDLPTDKPAAAVRKFKVVRREDTDCLANQAFAGLTGTAVRPTFGKASVLMAADEGYRWVDGRGRLAGYVYVKHDAAKRRLQCFEAVGDPAQVLRVLGKLCRSHGCQELELINQPIRTPLMRQIRSGRCQVVSKRNANGGPMARVVNLRTTLEKMAGELHARLRGSSMNKWRGTLVIDDGDEKVGLRLGAKNIAVCDSGKSAHSIKTNGHTAQLVWGTEEPSVLMNNAKIKTTGDAAPLITALFPGQDPMLPSFDHF